MAYITLANTNKIIHESDLNVELKGDIYKLPIYFFSKYEVNALLAIRELLEHPEHFFTRIYKPYKPKDTFRYIYEGKAPSYHEKSDCPRLQSNFKNFEIPSQIVELGTDAVIEFRKWFEENKHLLETPDKFVFRLMAKYGIQVNPKSINYENSGYAEMQNEDLNGLEEKIDGLIKAAGRFYYQSEKNKDILKVFSKKSYYANKNGDIVENNTGYSDQEVRSLLREYEEKFKKPLKRMLITYYRLKFNPDIKMEGHFLEALGFKPCGHCINERNNKNFWGDNNTDNSFGGDLPF
jgi:hypothetical protein